MIPSTGNHPHFIQAAIKHPGALTRKAQAAHETTGAFAREHVHSPGDTGREARLAIILRHLHSGQ